MKTKKLMYKIVCFYAVLMIFLSSSQVASQAALIWLEDFPTDGVPDGWTIFNYDIDSNDVYTHSVVQGFSVVDGVLRAPNSQNFNTETHAIHDSPVAYGNWSFDWFVANGVDHLACDLVGFMITDLTNNYNYDGFTLDEFLSNMIGYELFLVSSNATSFFPGFSRPGVTLIKYPDLDILDTHQFSSDIEGSHHIDIERNLQGQISVYFDSELIVQATDNTTTTSEKIFLASLKGDSGIDNITVYTTTTIPTTTTMIPTTTTTTKFPSLFILFSVGVLIILRKKKLK